MDRRGQKLPNELIIEIWYAIGSRTEIKNKYNVSYETIRKIKNQTKYKDITDSLDPKGILSYWKLTDQQRNDIILMNATVKEIAAHYNISEQTVRNIHKQFIYYRI